jgi:hypothetical protein
MFADALLARAAAEPPPRWKFLPGQRYREMPATFALHLLALEAHLEPNRKVNGTPLAAAVAEKLQTWLGGTPADAEGHTREPEAQGGLGGWTHNAAAQTLLLAKRTFAIWSRLTEAERRRADLIMQALAVAGHFTLGDANNYHVLLDGISPNHKSWNPNITEGYVDVMVAAAQYFEPAELKAFFRGFDFSGFVSELERHELRNISRCWRHTPAVGDLLMQGGPHHLGGGTGPVQAGGVTGHGHGVRQDFTFFGYELTEPWALYRTQADRLYAKAVRTEIIVHGDNRSRLLQRATDATVSPWEGRMGMCAEFEGTDWFGLRTSLTYAFEGVMINLGTAATLKVLGAWRDDAAGRDIARRMAVGVSDLKFKAHEGYRGWAGGKETKAWLEQDLQPIGSDYIFPLWTDFFPPPEAN